MSQYYKVPSLCPQWKALNLRTQPLRNRYVKTEEIIENRFSFLNVTKRFGRHIDWNPKDVGRLWIYNLHYFDYLDDLLSSNPEYALEVVNSWIENNPPGTINAWDPYPLSLRIVSWVLAFSFFKKPESLPSNIACSLYQQLRWLERSLEWHLLANHLFKNAKALIFGGLFFQGKDSKRWLEKGLSILRNELNEQIMSDGGHFERSPMYHAMILKDCLDLINVRFDNRAYPDPQLIDLWNQLQEMLLQRIPDMIRFLKWMSHPDGKIALFNDAAFGIEPDCADLTDYASAILGNSPKIESSNIASFQASGYYVMRPSRENYLVIDCGPVGPDYQPGHSHSDNLSFELSVRGTRVIVDSGTYQYESGELRHYNRGNKGHNTVTVDGQNQSEVWGAHRCARRARPLYGILKNADNGCFRFKGAHDGYARLRGKPIHRRKITWDLSNAIAISDEVSGSGNHDVELRLHVHPSFDVKNYSRMVSLYHEGERWLTVQPNGPGTISIQSGWYCPEFGKKEPCKVLVLNFPRVSLPFKSGWVLKL